MSNIIHPVDRDDATLSLLLTIWEGSVKSTHTFLSDQDIADIKPEVYQALEMIEVLCCYEDDQGILQGIMGIDNHKIELLFISENARGQGIGKLLVNHAITQWQVKSVDVNAQNEQGLIFYQHMGFQIINRSEFDAQGRPFPILHLGLK